MRTDRELLELAAKAAGFEMIPWQNELGFVIRNSGGFPQKWNPLVDDGDALRLAVKLGLGTPLGTGFDIEVCAQHSGARNFCYAEPHGADPYAATRRAIVRAAATIAEAM